MIFYRAMPIEADGIRSGDYLTPSLKFAREHALTTSVYHGEDYGVFVVLLGKDEYREASNPGEYIYTGKGKEARLMGIAKYNDEYADSKYQRVKLGTKEQSRSRLALLMKYANLSKNFSLKQKQTKLTNSAYSKTKRAVRTSMISKMAKDAMLSSRLESLVREDQGPRSELATYYNQVGKDKRFPDHDSALKQYKKDKNIPEKQEIIFESLTSELKEIYFHLTKHKSWGTLTDKDWDNIWLLAQHADDDRSLQRNILDKILKHPHKEQQNHANYLSDRLSCAELGTQNHGTQDICSPEL